MRDLKETTAKRFALAFNVGQLLLCAGLGEIFFFFFFYLFGLGFCLFLLINMSELNGAVGVGSEESILLNYKVHVI